MDEAEDVFLSLSNQADRPEVGEFVKQTWLRLSRVRAVGQGGILTPLGGLKLFGLVLPVDSGRRKEVKEDLTFECCLLFT